MSQPKILLIGGANGTGKTTLAREFVARERWRYLGADEIAHELNPTQPETVAISAAREFSQRLETAIARREFLLVEATLSGKSLRQALVKARQQGYDLTVAFVYLDSAEVCIARIAARVARGGHQVPDADVRRRFLRANSNFWQLYRHIVDRWFLYYNADAVIEEVANGDVDGENIVDSARYKQWLTIVK